MVTAITGNKNHQMEFVSESYGGTYNKQGSATTDDEKDDEHTQDDEDDDNDDNDNAVVLTLPPHLANVTTTRNNNNKKNNTNNAGSSKKKNTLNTRIHTSYFNAADDRRRMSFSRSMSFFNHLNKSSSRLLGKETTV